ncbi:hypothetical protein DGM85_04575 [Xanthomonas phaseoli pv. phaseoli]|nr:hypothetical protein DGM85_04575 [Xanthomonas phaseoli pv. phaseoli]
MAERVRQATRRHLKPCTASARHPPLIHRTASPTAYTKSGMIRPGFPRHLMAMENSRFGDVYEQQAVYG